MDYDDPQLRDRLTLSMVQGVGPLAMQRLLTHFSSATTVLAASMGELQYVPGVGPTLAKRITMARTEIDVDTHSYWRDSESVFENHAFSEGCSGD